MGIRRISSAILKQLEKTIGAIDAKQTSELIKNVLCADKVFLAGSGRSNLVAKSFAHRIVNVCSEVYVVGETITPSASKNDVVIAISGSGETAFTLNVAEVGKKIGATIIAITSYPESPLGALADVVIEIKGRASQDADRDYLARQIMGMHEPLTPVGATFELACMVFLESTAIELGRMLE